MNGNVPTIDAAGLKSALHDGGEIALLDAREEVPFDARHLLMASCVPFFSETTLFGTPALISDCAPMMLRVRPPQFTTTIVAGEGTRSANR